MEMQPLNPFSHPSRENYDGKEIIIEFSPLFNYVTGVV